MKKRIIWLLLSTFLYQTFSSFLIVSSFYINREYISENICINRFDTITICRGICYLESELSENSEREKEIPTVKTPELQPLFCEPADYEIYATSKSFPVHKMYPEHRSAPPLSALLFSVFQPPEIC